MQKLDWTGERLIADCKDDYFVFEHLHRYALAKKISAGKTVLDIACGEGYGTYLISEAAKFVYGVDIDAATIEHAEKKYGQIKENISFKFGSTSNIPLDDATVDIVISFETIEHHDKHQEMMKEIKRVLKKDGILLVSSPNKVVYNTITPNNPFHIKELTIDEFQTLISSFFKQTYYYEQKFVVGSLITPMNCSAQGFETYDGNYEWIGSKLQEADYYNKAYYNLALCSDDTIMGLPSSLFNGAKAVLAQAQRIEEKTRRQVMNSTSFKIGKWIVEKFSFLKKKSW